jgi:hypothetical protein
MNIETHEFNSLASESLTDLVNGNPLVRYSRPLYLAACREINSLGIIKPVKPVELPANASIHQMLAYVPIGFKTLFFRIYAWRVYRFMILGLLCYTMARRTPAKNR